MFEKLTSVLQEHGVIRERNAVIADLVRREAVGSTAIGNGVAIPHLMLPGLETSQVVMLRLRQAVSFDAVDGKPVSLVFLVVSPQGKRQEYLQILSALATALHHEHCIQRLNKAGDAKTVIAILTTREREGFLARNSRLLYFLGAAAIVFLLFATVLPRLSIPVNDVTLANGQLKFNEPLWVGKQIWAAGIFFTTVIGTLLFWQYRVAIAAFGLGLLLLTGTMDLATTVDFMSIPTILFIISMMVVVAWLDYLGFFRSIVTQIIVKVGPYPRRIFFILMLFSVFLGGLTGEVTGILVVATIAIALCNEMDLNPFPFVISLVFSTNIGSALTLIGNPIGIYIAFSGGLSFEDFLRWATPLSLLTTVLVAGLLLILFRRSIPARAQIHSAAGANSLHANNRTGPNGNASKMLIAAILFVLLIIAVGFSKRLDTALGLAANTTLVAVPLAFVGVIIFLERGQGKLLITEGVDWWTILFFMFLFAKAACLEYTGVTPKLAYQVEHLAQAMPLTFLSAESGVTITALVIITSITALASGFVDNLPIIAALVPIVKELKLIGLPHADILWWGLLFGGCFGGNLTMIGSSANMVALSVFERSEGRTISFRRWFKYGLPVMIISLLFVLLLLALQINLAR